MITGDENLDAALWAADYNALDELAPCRCCCHEHTSTGCAARVWGGCRGQGITEEDEEGWREYLRRTRGMTSAQFYGEDAPEGDESETA